MSERLVIFDCDGTLADSQNFITSCILQSFSEAQVELPANLLPDVMLSMSLKDLMHFLSDKVAAERLDLVYHTVLTKLQQGRESGLNHEPLFQGVSTMLSTLVARGYKMAIATNKRKSGVQSVLRLNGIETLFCFSATSEDFPSKPAPDMIHGCIRAAAANSQTSVMVGDSLADILSAQHAGVKSIAVTWGLKNCPDFASAGASRVINHVSDLPRAVSELIG